MDAPTVRNIILENKVHLPNSDSEDLLIGFHSNYAPHSEDPCQYIQHLGEGMYGFVDAVTLKSNRGRAYARKVVRLAPHRRQQLLRDLQEEVRAIRSLAHIHVIKIEATYTLASHFALLMSPIADRDLRSFLEEADNEPIGSKRSAMQTLLLKWPGCLIQALNHLHERRVKHRDIKPANILIRHEDVILADFGLSKTIPPDDTTKSDIPFGGTALYLAPEAHEFGQQQHGRAADVFALGCVLLEMATVLIAPPDSRKRLFEYRKPHNLQATSVPRGPQMALAQWIWHLWGFWNVYCGLPDSASAPFMDYGIAIPDLAFLALDPNPETRITMAQLCAMLTDPEAYYYMSVNVKSCVYCRLPLLNQRPITGLPMHSVLKSTEEIRYPANPYAALTVEFATDWEAVKKAWLSSHMWWPPAPQPTALADAIGRFEV